MPHPSSGYDDTCITLGGSSVLAIDQSPSGVALVRGSRQFVRDPRLHPLGLTDDAVERRYHLACRPRPDEKWCPPAETYAKTEFSPNKRSADGLYYQCKDCEAKRKREAYRARIGRRVRQYVKHAEADTSA